MSEKNEWKLVPVVPTDDMEAAAEDDYEQTGATFPRWKSAYAAMLAAAPAAADAPLASMACAIFGDQIGGQMDAMAGTPAPSAPGDALELKRKTDLVGELSKIIHNMTVAQQAAWIEWRHGAGADAAMQWIENGLAGPGQIPDEDEPYGTEAQAYFDANQADPFPACHCGRPSNILHMGSGYCSNEHYRAALAAQVPQQGEA